MKKKSCTAPLFLRLFLLPDAAGPYKNTHTHIRRLTSTHADSSFVAVTKKLEAPLLHRGCPASDGCCDASETTAGREGEVKKKRSHFGGVPMGLVGSALAESDPVI